LDDTVRQIDEMDLAERAQRQRRAAQGGSIIDEL
jgi:hypothetical protein